jgi:hypothetical protein
MKCATIVSQSRLCGDRMKFKIYISVILSLASFTSAYADQMLDRCVRGCEITIEMVGEQMNVMIIAIRLTTKTKLNVIKPTAMIKILVIRAREVTLNGLT